MSDSLFGAQFLSLLDAYRYVERSIKYGILFLVLVFTTFFLFEVTARQKIHPFQYLMVGAALCLFYLLLLSVSEFVGFGLAYLAAAVASTLLITWYCRSFLGGGMRTKAGDTEQRRMVDPAAKHGCCFQARSPPGIGLAGLVLKGRAECLGMVLQTFKAEVAIDRGVMRLEAAHLEALLGHGGIGPGHGFL